MDHSIEETYRRLSDAELKRLLRAPKGDFRSNAYEALKRVVAERDLDRVVPHELAEDPESVTDAMAAGGVVADKGMPDQGRAAQEAYRDAVGEAIFIQMFRFLSIRLTPYDAHLVRVSNYSVAIFEEWADRTSVAPTERLRLAREIRWGALLHDIGMVGISDLVVKKPARLKAEEYEIMKTHPVTGALLFWDGNLEIDLAIRDIVLHHHERWDGTGYPGNVTRRQAEDGVVNSEPLVAEQIPVLARIVHVAEVYDSLRSEFAYKDAWEERATLVELKNLAGSWLDPYVVDDFFRILPRIGPLAGPDGH